MIFHGFQKLTLLDFPEHTACTLFTAGCNFRCPFCHNALLVTDIDNEVTYSEEEILSYLEKRKGLLDGVAITGGEPLMHKDIGSFMKKVKDLGYAVKLDTNGSFPSLLKELVNSGLVDYVAMDVKNCPEKYGATIGVENFDLSPIQESMDFLLSGKVPFEFRTTIVKEFHTVEDVEKIAHWIKGCKRYFLQNFKDSGNLIEDGLHSCDKEVLVEMQEKAIKILGSSTIRGI